MATAEESARAVASLGGVCGSDDPVASPSLSLVLALQSED